MKVAIRPCQIDDAISVQQYISDELVNRTTNAPWPYPKNGGITFINSALKNWEQRTGFLFSILINNKMIGDVGLNRPDFEEQTIRCDYAISSLYWSQGITTLAVKLAISYAFTKLDIKVIYSSCLDRNPASSRVLEKNGFSKIDQFIYNTDKFENELAYRFMLTMDQWKNA